MVKMGMVNKKWHLAVFFVRVNSTPVYGIVPCCPVFERTAEKVSIFFTVLFHVQLSVLIIA